jgi:hypothetical protein
MYYNLHIYTTTQEHYSTIKKGVIMAERNMVNMTFTVTREERKALKQLALDNDTTVSALIRQWMKEYKENGEIKGNG